MTTQPSAIIGQVSIVRYMPNATNAPTVIVPRTTSEPPRPSTTATLNPASSPNIGFIAPYSRASAMFFFTYVSFSAAKRAISASSCRYARTTRTPAKFSCACVVSVLKCSCTASNRRWIAPPMRIMMTGSITIGTSASAVSLASMRSMNTSANVAPKIVFVRYMIAGPAAMRTALRSLVRPRHEVARARPAEVARIERRQVLEQRLPQIVLDVAAEPVEDLAHPVAQRAADQRHADDSLRR